MLNAALRVRIGENIKRQLEARAISRAVTVGAVVRRALDEHFSTDPAGSADSGRDDRGGCAQRGRAPVGQLGGSAS